MIKCPGLYGYKFSEIKINESSYIFRLITLSSLSRIEHNIHSTFGFALS
jgi:hypothetical protein